LPNEDLPCQSNKAKLLIASCYYVNPDACIITSITDFHMKFKTVRNEKWGIWIGADVYVLFPNFFSYSTPRPSWNDRI